MNAPAKFTSNAEMLADDVARIVELVPYLEVAPASLFTSGLVSELADAVDRLALKVGKLQEAGECGA